MKIALCLTAPLVAALVAPLVACTPAPTSQPAPQPAQDASAQPESEVPTFRDCIDCPEMVRIPAGAFQMGSAADEAGRQADEGPVHRVVIAKPFALSAFEISTGEYRKFIEATGRTEVDWKMFYSWTTVDFPYSTIDRDLYPAAAVSWQDARDYAAWLSQQTGQHYRLPTEAEWEYAARAGIPGTALEPMALRRPLPGWLPNSTGDLYPVTAFGANAFGVHGLTANMGEWLEDCYVADYDHAPSDGSAVEGTCAQRVVRGQHSYLGDAYERIANRDWGYAVNRGEGIRLARDLP